MVGNFDFWKFHFFCCIVLCTIFSRLQMFFSMCFIFSALKQVKSLRCFLSEQRSLNSNSDCLNSLCTFTSLSSTVFKPVVCITNGYSSVNSRLQSLELSLLFNSMPYLLKNVSTKMSLQGCLLPW